MHQRSELLHRWKEFLDKKPSPDSTRWATWSHEGILELEILVERGRAHSQNQAWSEALSFYQAVLEQGLPLSGLLESDYQVCRAWINRGVILSRTGKDSEALRVWQESFSIFGKLKHNGVQEALVIASRLLALKQFQEQDDWKALWIEEIKDRYIKGEFRGAEKEILQSWFDHPTQGHQGLEPLLQLLWNPSALERQHPTNWISLAKDAWIHQSLVWRESWVWALSESGVKGFSQFRGEDSRPLWSWERQKLAALVPSLELPRPQLIFQPPKVEKDLTENTISSGKENHAVVPKLGESFEVGSRKLHWECNPRGHWNLKGPGVPAFELEDAPELQVGGSTTSLLVLGGNRLYWLREHRGRFELKTKDFPQGLLVAAQDLGGQVVAVADKKNRIHLWWADGKEKRLVGSSEWVSSLNFVQGDGLETWHLGGGYAFWTTQEPFVCRPEFPWPVQGLGGWNETQWILLLPRNLMLISTEGVVSNLWDTSAPLTSACQSATHLLVTTGEGHLRLYALGNIKPLWEKHLGIVLSLTAVSDAGEWAAAQGNRLWFNSDQVTLFEAEITLLVWTGRGLVIGCHDTLFMQTTESLVEWGHPGFTIHSWKQDPLRGGLWGLGEASLAFWNWDSGDIQWILRTHHRGLEGLGFYGEELIIRLGKQKMLLWQEPFDLGPKELDGGGVARWDHWMVLPDLPFVVSAGEAGVRIWSWPEILPAGKLTTQRRSWAGLHYNLKTRMLAAVTHRGEWWVWQFKA